MSAFIVEIEAIHYLVAATRAPRWRVGCDAPSIAESNALGQMLVDANHVSVNTRYNERNEPEIYAYDLRFDAVPLNPVQVIKTAHCLDYQSCEFDGWPQCDAKKALDRIIEAATYKLPGYDAAEWGAPKLVLPPKRPVRPIRRAS